MNEIPSVPISDFENEIPPQSPARKLRSDKGASLTSPLGRCPMPAWSPSHGLLHHTIRDTQ